MTSRKTDYLRLFEALIIAILAFLLLSGPSYAQDSAEDALPPMEALEEADLSVDIMPAKSLAASDLEIDLDAPTHPPVKLTPDKSQLLKLDMEVSTIVIGNPNHLSILADNAQTLVLVGRAPGATHFTALDKNGDIVMQRHVIVASPKEKYVRIRRSCAGGGENCMATQVYYCPDMCHEIITSSGSESDSAGGATAEATEDLAEETAGGSGESADDQMQ